MIEMLRSLIREIDPAAEQSLNGFLDSLTMSQGVVFIDSKINQTEFMEKFREYAKSLFDEREAFIASFNLLLDGVFTKNLDLCGWYRH